MRKCSVSIADSALQRSSSFKDFMKPKPSSPIVSPEATLDESVSAVVCYMEMKLLYSSSNSLLSFGYKYYVMCSRAN